MRTRLLALLCVVGLAGCPIEVIEPDGGRSSSDGPKCPASPDLTPPSSPCAAAKGLSGDILGGLCLDMDKIDTQGLTSRGFNLTFSLGNCAGWEVAGNKLQPKNINTSGGIVNCGLLLPNLPFDAAKYPRVMLALIHQANLPNAMQQARIELPAPSSPPSIWVNPAATVDQRTIVEIDAAKIPSGPNAQVSILLGAPANSMPPSWTISSMAVLGQPTQ